MITLISNGVFCDIGIPEVVVDSYGSRDVNLEFLYRNSIGGRTSRASSYWRLTGRDGSQLFSIEIKGGVVVSVGLILYRSDQVTIRDFSGLSDAYDFESTPVFDFEFENSGPAADVKGSCIDIAHEFSVDLHGSRLRVSWLDDTPSRVLSVGSRVFFELSPDGALMAVACVVPDVRVVESLLLAGTR